MSEIKTLLEVCASVLMVVVTGAIIILVVASLLGLSPRLYDHMAGSPEVVLTAPLDTVHVTPQCREVARHRLGNAQKDSVFVALACQEVGEISRRP